MFLSHSFSPCVPHTLTLNLKPLFCISFLVLLLLPLSLSCGSVQLDNIRSDYIAIIQTELQRTVSKTRILFLCLTRCLTPNIVCSVVTLYVYRYISAGLKVFRRRGATRRRRNEGTKNRKETKKLCKAKAILSAMTECYEMLNSL
uniref:Uncharacterized protein n=1 Tax=Neolamprologus brichardi TaxID=32507 RepID=A0A3Q4GSJ5_NEOBR